MGCSDRWAAEERGEGSRMRLGALAGDQGLWASLRQTWEEQHNLEEDLQDAQGHDV